MVLFKGNPPGGAEGRPFCILKIIMLFDLFLRIASFKSYSMTCMDPWQLLLPSEIFSRVMQDCHYHADTVRILAENKAVAVRRFK